MLVLEEITYTVLDGVGSACTDRDCADKLHDGGSQRRLPHRERLGRDGRREGVGNVISPDVVGYESCRYRGAKVQHIGENQGSVLRTEISGRWC